MSETIQDLHEECKFKLGDVVFWDPANLNKEFWTQLSQEEKDRYYTPLMFRNGRKRLFVFITEINQAPGHCVLVPLDDGPVEWMRHTSEFTLADEDDL